MKRDTKTEPMVTTSATLILSTCLSGTSTQDVRLAISFPVGVRSLKLLDLLDPLQLESVGRQGIYVVLTSR